MNQVTEPIKRNCTHGINSLDDLKGRCWVDDATGCWHWRGAKRALGDHPSLWIPALGRTMPIRNAASFLSTGIVPAHKAMWLARCGNSDCGNPEHHKRATRSQVRAVNGPWHHTTAARRAIADWQRSNGKLDEAKAAEIRGSAEPARVLAERYGISVNHVSAVRRGSCWKPIVAPASSIFNWGASA